MSRIFKFKTYILIAIMVCIVSTHSRFITHAAASPIEVKVNLMLGDDKFIMYETSGKGLVKGAEYDLFIYENRLFSILIEDVGDNYALARMLPPAGFYDLEGKGVTLLLKANFSPNYYPETKIKKLPPIKVLKPEPAPEKPEPPKAREIKRRVIDVSDIDASMEPEKPRKKQEEPRVSPPVTSSIVRFDSTKTDGKSDKNVFTTILSLTSKKGDNVRTGYVLFTGNYQSSESRKDSMGIGLSYTHYFEKDTWAMASYTFMTHRYSRDSITDTETDTFFAGIFNKFGYHRSEKHYFKASIGASSDSSFHKNRYISGQVSHTSNLSDKSTLVVTYRNTYNYDLKTHMQDAYSIDFSVPFLKKSKVTFGYKKTDRDDDVFGVGADDSDTYKITVYTKY